MTQTHSPENPQQPTQPLWYGEHARMSQPPQPGPQSPAEPPPPVWTQAGAEHAQPAKPRRWTEITAVAVLAALLASGTTYAVTRGDSGGASTTTAAQSSAPQSGQATNPAPVAQGNAYAPNWSATAKAVAPSVVSITVETQGGGDQGSGVVIDTKGHVLTNNHVVSAAAQGGQITVTLNDQRTYTATVAGTDPATDLAVLTLQGAPSDLKPIAMGDANTLIVGQPVMAVGNPLGLAGTVTTGIVSALNRPVTTTQDSSGSAGGSSGEPVVTNAIQTSAAINPGNSGGALVNASGQLVGINSAIASLDSSGSGSQSGNIGIGFAIPVNEARSIAQQLISTGTAKHAYLGVSSRDAVVKLGSARRTAAEITQVVSGTPADKAGLRAGDAIIAVDGETIDSSLSLVGQIRERTVGAKTTLTVIRDGKQQDIPVTLATRPDQNQ